MAEEIVSNKKLLGMTTPNQKILSSISNFFISNAYAAGMENTAQILKVVAGGFKGGFVKLNYVMFRYPSTILT